MDGTLYLIPTTLGECSADGVIPAGVQTQIRRLAYFIAENPKSARAYLKLLGSERSLQSINIARLDHNTPAGTIDSLLAPLLAGHDAGLVSEAGCPAVADPGAMLVRKAHERGLRVAPLVGPSSILLALIASGLEGQRFAFHGYLPVRPPERNKLIRDLESRSSKNRETQIIIETPYRNMTLYSALLDACRPETLLCVASNLTLAAESVRTRRIVEWKKERPELEDQPSVFLMLANR